MKYDDSNSKDNKYQSSRQAHEPPYHHGRGRREDPFPLLKRMGVHQGVTIADIGCGDGHYTIPMASMVGESGLVLAVDRNAKALSLLQGNLKTSGVKVDTVRILRADASKTGIPSKSVDFVFLANMFHDIEEKGELVKEVKRLLKPTGIAVDLDWTKNETLFGPPFDMRITEKEVENIFREFGFTEINYFNPDPYHYCLVFRAQGSLTDIQTNTGDYASEHSVIEPSSSREGSRDR